MNSVTPEGVLVYVGEPLTDAWFRVRRGGITGTDLPKILGLSKYGTALSVWLSKRGEASDSAGEAAEWGHLLEDVVAQEWARRNDTRVTTVGIIANAWDDWMRASLDRLVVVCPDTGEENVCGLEVKTRSAYKRGSFKDGEPDDVLAQVSWGLRVTGLDHMHLAVLIGGQELLSFRVDRDAELEQYLYDAAVPVWASVVAGDPPEVHPDAEGVLLADLNRLYNFRDGAVALPHEAETWIAAYRTANGQEYAAKKVKEEAKSALVQMLAGGNVGTLDDAPAFTYVAPEPKFTITADDLREFEVTNPELYVALIEDGVITQTSPGPRFNLKRKQ